MVENLYNEECCKLQGLMFRLYGEKAIRTRLRKCIRRNHLEQQQLYALVF